MIQKSVRARVLSESVRGGRSRAGGGDITCINNRSIHVYVRTCASVSVRGYSSTKEEEKGSGERLEGRGKEEGRKRRKVVPLRDLED